MTKTARVTTMQALLPADPYALAARFALSLSGLVAMATMAAALYTYAPSVRMERTAMSAASYDAAQARWSPAPIDAEEPVLFANPFDEDEVFEFPHGTSESEARAAVAQMLMERARERYARLDLEVHRRR